ncbi:MAG: LytR C-terminal domain-containing protein, partial [Actinomycetota bacterium]|nr:LytR C-terminal domain-containing protein [Actinomycetota bacterium]
MTDDPPAPDIPARPALTPTSGLPPRHGRQSRHGLPYITGPSLKAALTETGPSSRAAPSSKTGPSSSRAAAPSKELERKRASETRKAAKLERHEDKRALRAHRRELRRSKDIAVFHGHHVVSGPDLQRVFTPVEDAENAVQFRHRLVHGVILTLLSAVVIAGVIFAVLLWRGAITLPSGQASAPAVRSCPAATFDYPANKDMHVNVYNSTRREGLAASVAAELKGRGFQVDTIANKVTNYTGSAVIVSGAAGQSAAFNLQRNLAGTDYVQDDRTDASVDVYLTGGFTVLVDAGTVDQTPGLLSCPHLSP